MQRANASGMKSAYELAMERLQKTAPTVALSDAQKAEIAEIDSRYRAKIAERELLLRGELDKARAQGDGEAVGQLERQLVDELRRLNAECEEKKERVRGRGQG
jgi:hypothetical protein